MLLSGVGRPVTSSRPWIIQYATRSARALIVSEGLTEGGPGTSTETIAIYVYRQAIQFNKTSDSTAMSYILLFIVIVLTNLYLYLANRRAKEEA